MPGRSSSVEHGFSPVLASASSRSRRRRGPVVTAGMVSTDALFPRRSNARACHGVHNWALQRPEAVPREGRPDRRRTGCGRSALTQDGVAPEGRPGLVESIDLLPEYADHCRSFVDDARLAPLKVAIDAGNGMAGATVPAVFSPLPFEVEPLYFELDGSFPNHPANPIEPEKSRPPAARRREGCHAGIAFDGGRRSHVPRRREGRVRLRLDDHALVADRLLRRSHGASVIYKVICSWAVREVIEENGGKQIGQGGH